MADKTPVTRADGPAARGTAQEAGAVSGAAAQQVDPALGTAFQRTHHLLMLEFGEPCGLR